MTVSPGIGSDHPLVDFLTVLTTFGLENTVARRFYAKYHAVVVDNVDPSEEGRVKVRVDLRGSDEPLSLWANPSSPYAGFDRGFYTPPEEGDMVWVWFDHGDLEHPNYSGGWWCNPQRAGPNSDNETKPLSSHVPSEFKTGGSPTARGLKTKIGLMVFEDAPSRGPGITLATITPTGSAEDATKNHVFTMTEMLGASKIEVVTAFGHTFVMDDQQQLISIQTAGGPFLELNTPLASALLQSATGSIEISDAQQAILLTTVGKLDFLGQLASTISATAGLTLAATGGVAMLSGLTVALASTAGAAGILLGTGAVLRLVTEALIAIFNANAAVFNAHEHQVEVVGAGNLGAPVLSVGIATPSGTPMAPADFDSVTTNTTRAT